MTNKINQLSITIIGLGGALCVLFAISIMIYYLIPPEYHNPTKLYSYINTINISNGEKINLLGLCLSFIASLLGLCLAKDSFSKNKSNRYVVILLVLIFIAPFFYGDNIINSFSQVFITWALIFFSMFENTRDKR